MIALKALYFFQCSRILDAIINTPVALATTLNYQHKQFDFFGPLCRECYDWLFGKIHISSYPYWSKICYVF